MMPNGNFWDRQFSQVKSGKKPALTIDEMQGRDKPELALSDSNVEKQVDTGAADVGKSAVSGVLGWGESVAEAAAKPGFTAEQQQQVIEEGYSPESVAVLDANKNILELVAEKGRDWFGQNKEAVRESMSVNAKKALEAELINENLSFTDDAAKLSTWIMKGTETLSRMVPDLVLGGMGSKQIYNQTFEMMFKKGVEKGLSQEAAKIAADKAAKGAMSATTAQMATISATGGTGVQIRETIENTPWNELTKSETFKANFSAIDQDPQYEGVSDKEKLNLARTMTAEQAATNVQQDPALLAVNAASSFLGDATLGRIIQGRIGGGIAEKAIKGFAAEAPTEAGQGAMEQYAQNMVLIDVAGADIDPTKGVARAALEGAVLGGAIGGGVGGATGVAEKVTGREQVVDMPEDPTVTAAEPEAAPVEPEPQRTVAERRQELDEKLRGQRVTSGLGDVQEALARDRAPTAEELIAQARTQPAIEPETEVQTEERPKTVAERREALNQRLESQRAEYESKRIEAGEGEVQQRLSRPAAPSVEELIAKAPAETGPTPGELEFRSQQNREYLENVKAAKIPQAMRNKPGATRLLNKGYRKAMEDIGSLAGKMSGKKELSPEVDTMTKAIEKLGGLQRDLSEAEGMDPASFKRNRLFPATGGMTFDHAAEVLNEQGYKNREGGRLTANDVVDMVYGEANNNERHLSSYADADMLTADADMVRQWSDEIGGTDKLNTAITKALKGEKLGKRQAEIVGEVLDTINAIRSDNVDLAKQELQSRREEREQRRVDEFNKAYQELTEVDDSALYDYERYAESFGEMPDYFTDQQELLSELVSNAGDRDYQATEKLITDYDNGDVSLPSLLDQLSEIASRENTYEQAKPSIQTVSKPAPQRVERSDEARTEAIEPAPAVEPTVEPEPTATEPATEPEPTATAEPEQRVEPEPTAPDGLEAEAKPTTEDFANNTYQQWEDVSKKAVEGDLTPEQYNEAAKQFLADKDRIQVEINKAETKPKLIKKLGPMAAYRAKSEKKDYAVNAYYQQLMARFHIDGGVISYSMGKNAYENAIIKSTEGLTQSDIDTYKTELAKKREEYSSRFKQAAKSIKNPETLAEFKEYLQYKSESSLTPEQRSRYDELITAERMEKTGEAKKAKAVKAGLETDEAVSVESMEPGTHGKTGEPIINVKLSKLGKDQFKQAAAQARSMKGGYWRGSFYLPDQASADQFVAWAKGESIDRTESVTKGEEIKQKSVVSKLETMAEKLKATAEADLNVDRRENTVRQMRQADSSRGKAEKQVQLADMMNMIAKGFEDGSVKYLSGITSKAQLEEVIRSYDALKYNIPNPSNNDLVSMDNMSRPYWKDSTTIEQKVQFARLPFADFNGHMIGELAKRMSDVTGYKQAANQLAKIAKQTGERNYTTLDVNAPYFAKALDFAKKQGKYTTFADQAVRFSRLQRMGIDNGSALRASLIELDTIKSKLKAPKQKTTVETMERDLKRKVRLNRNAFNDFFPTPQTISQDIIDLADIKEGMKVLEPSAGNGELAQAISNAGGDLDVVELAGDLRNILTEKGFNLVGDDFLNYSTGADYDRIVMNPPFSNDQDIDHIYHAFNMLKPGGRIVAITSSMAGDRSNNKNKQFREWLDNLNAEEADLPSDAFMDSLNPTGVNTKVITIDKPVKSNGDDRAQFSQNSRTTGTPKGVSIKEAELLAVQFLKKYKGAAGAKVKVFATQSEALAYGGIDLPDDVKVNAYRIPQTGEIVLIAENLDNARDVWQKLRHEILAHHGLYNLVGESEWRKIMNLVSQSRESGELKEVWDQIDTNYPELREDLKAEEVIAHIAEYEPGKMGEFADRIISAVIRALRNIGLINPGMMQVEIRDLIRVVGQRIKSLDSIHGSIRNDVMFSKEVAEPSGFSIPDETRKDRFLRGIADKYRRLKVVQESVKEQGGRITEGEDVYLAEELFHGKIGEDMRSMEADYIKPLQDAMIEKNVDAQELDLYLIARHAPERNAHIAEINPKMQDGGSGMTNAEASEIMSRFESEGKTADMEAAAAYVDKMLKSTRERLVESGLETIDAVESWDSAYKFYVPLKGFANNEVDTEGNSVKPTGRGFNIRGKETMKAMGRRTMAESPVAYAISDATQSMMRARKNEVGQTLLRLVDANHDPELWQVFSDENPDIIRRITKQRDPVTGKMRDQVIDAPAPMFALKDQYLGVKMNGEQYYIKLNDVRLMEAMSNLGVEQANLLTKTLGRVTRMLSALITSYNPEFALSNLARDIQTAMYNVLAESEVKGGKAEGAKGLASQIAKDVASGRSFKALKKGLRDNNFEGEWGKYFKEYLDSGAKTGYFVQKEIEEIKNDIQKSIAKTGPGAVNALLRSKDKVIKFVDDYNDVIENASRLSVYVNARKQGFTEKQAASLAKNLTVNFNRRGEMTNNLNAIYMFFNASVQGTMNMLRAVATPKDKSKSIFNPGFYNTTQKIAMMLPIATMMAGALNRSIGGEDDDGKAFYDKVPDFVKETNFVLMIPGSEGDYIKIPMPYGYNFFASVGLAVDKSINGDQTAIESGFDLVSAFAGAFNPLGITDSEEGSVQAVKMASPSVMKPFVEMATNENFYGGPLYKQQNPFGLKLPDSYNAQRRTWELAKGVSEWLNDATGGNEFKSGYVDIAPESFQHLLSFMGGGLGTLVGRTQDLAAKGIKGEEIEDKDVPFWRKYFGNISDSVDVAEMYDRFDAVKEAQRQLEGLPKKEALKYRANNTGLIRLIPLQKTINKELTKLNKRRREIESSKLSDERKKVIVDNIEEKKRLLASKFNKKYNDLVGE
ncbi:hypothetical protein VPHD171_0021 [Vibrio phage D171]